MVQFMAGADRADRKAEGTPANGRPGSSSVAGPNSHECSDDGTVSG